jgi:hypothetical protein
VKLVSRWTAADFSGGWGLLEGDDATAIMHFALMWSDLLELRLVPVSRTRSSSMRSDAWRREAKPFGRCGVGMLEHPTPRWPMIRKLKSGAYRLYSRKINPNTGKRRNLGTFASRAAAEKHEREVQYFKRH